MSVKGKKRKGVQIRGVGVKRGRTVGGNGRQDTRIRYVGDKGGRGRVPLAQAVVVGRICVMRMMVRGAGRTDEGRPRPDPG